MLSKTAVRRLTILARFMKSLPASTARKFDMGTWFEHSTDDHQPHVHGLKRGTFVQRAHMNKCGTVACALGWAATVPSFARAGLKLKVDYIGPDGHISGGVEFGKARGTEAAENFFEIDAYQAEYLFALVPANTPKQWAKACERFVKSGGEYAS